MKKKFMLGIIFLVMLVVSGCGGNVVTKQSLREQTTQVAKKLATQQTNLNRFQKELEATHIAFKKLNDNDDINAVTTAINSRTNTYEAINTNIKAQKGLVDDLKAAADKNFKSFPNQQIAKFVQSANIAFLDATGFDKYLSETVKIEGQIENEYDQHDHTRLKNDVDQLNGYYSALFQQLEIWQADLAAAKAHIHSLQTALN